MNYFHYSIIFIIFILACNKKNKIENLNPTTPPKNLIYTFNNKEDLFNGLTQYDFSKEKVSNYLECSQTLLNNDPSQPIGSPKNPFNLLTSSIEYANYKVGGVASVVNSLTPKFFAFANSKHFSNKSYLIVPLYNDGKEWKKPLKKICTIKHFFNSKLVQSEILLSEYTFDVSPNPVTLPILLIKPDENLKKIFNIFSEGSVYETNENSDTLNRSIYYSSAIASFTSNMSLIGQRFHILHSHSIFPGMANIILHNIEKKDRPKTIVHIHNLNWDQGFIPNATCNHYDPCNLMADSMLKSDFSITVSKTLIKEGLSKEKSLSFGLNDVYTSLYVNNSKKNRVFAVVNGIDFNNWDPTNPKNLKIKENGKELDFSFDSDDIYNSKLRIKKHLVSKGYISDPLKPLFVFIGRYSLEKGVDLLKKAALTIIENGGSFIVMGSRGPSYGQEMIDGLAIRFGDHPDIHIMKGDYLKEQLGEGKPGLLIRAAADFSIVPSYEESFGLVPIEFFTMGALAITSFVSGIQDYAKEFNRRTLTGNSFNFTTYKDLESTKDHKMKMHEHVFEEAIIKSFDYYSNTSIDKKNKVSKRIIEESKKFDWSSSGGSLEDLLSLYKEILSRS